MTTDFALAMTNEMLWTAILISVPILGVSMFVGLFISIFQVVTQIQEMSLTFVPKILAVALTMVALGPWMLGVLLKFSRGLIAGIPTYF